MKYKKYFKIKYNKNLLVWKKPESSLIHIHSLNTVNFTVPQMTAVVKSLKRVVKKKNFLINKCIPFWSITGKPRDVRMGRGKGSPIAKIFPVKAGAVLFEFKSNLSDLDRAIKSCTTRLPMKIKVVKINDKYSNSIKSNW